MRVVLAVCGTRKYSGLPKYFYLLAKYLRKEGIDVTLLVDSISGITRVEEIYPIRTRVIEPEVHNSLTTLQWCSNLSNYLLKNPDFDILHTAHVNPFFYLMQKTRKPVVFQPFGNELFTLSGRGLNSIYCKLAQPILRFCGHNADALLVEGKFQWDEMVTIYKNTNRMKILPVGVEIDVPQKSNYSYNRTYDILAVNSLLPYEGMDILIEAFKEVCKNIRAELTIVGTGPLESKLKDQARMYPVFFRKNLTEISLQALYANSDLFVSTSKETDTQMSILEAEAAGLPIVSMGQRWLIKDNGFICWDTPTLIDSILKAYKGDQESMGLISREIAKEFSVESIARQAIKIYEKL